MELKGSAPPTAPVKTMSPLPASTVRERAEPSALIELLKVIAPPPSEVSMDKFVLAKALPVTETKPLSAPSSEVCMFPVRLTVPPVKVTSFMPVPSPMAPIVKVPLALRVTSSSEAPCMAFVVIAPPEEVTEMLAPSDSARSAPLKTVSPVEVKATAEPPPATECEVVAPSAKDPAL